MNTTIAKILFSLITTATPVLALDLTPHEVMAGTTGPTAKRYFFQDEGKRLSFRMDNQMSVNGTPESAVFRFGDIKQGSVKVSKSQFAPTTPFDEKNIEAYRLAARSLLPTDAANVQIEERTNPITINGWTSQQFIFRYSLTGSPYSRSVTFLNLNDKQQIVFDVSSDATSYQKSYTRGYHVLNTLTDDLVKPDGPT